MQLAPCCAKVSDLPTCFANKAVLSNLIPGKSDVCLVSRMLDKVYKWKGSSDLQLVP